MSSVLALASAGCFMAVAGGAAAQETEPVATSGATVQEVVVTAERAGAVQIQKAPIAISVVNTLALQRQGGSGFQDYLTNLPSIKLDSPNPGENQFIIRGLSLNGFNETDTQQKALVSVYLDDTPISIEGNTPDLDVADLERVEVVRGPQGTLFGAGAMAGNIRLVTVKPNLQTYSGSVEATATDVNYGGIGNSIRAVINAPLVNDKLALRAGFSRSDDAGYIDNIGTGEKNANSVLKTQGRLALRYQPTDRLTVDLSATYARLHSFGFNTTLPGLGYAYMSNIPEGYHDTFRLYNADINYELPFATITSSTSYIDRKFGQIYSWQYALHRYLYKSLTDAQTQSIIAPDEVANKLHDFDEEVKINSTTDGPLHWIGGAFYKHETRDFEQNVLNPGNPTGAPPTAGVDALLGPGSTSLELGAPVADEAYYGKQDVTEHQFAVFGEASYEFLQGLKATIGARYFDFTQDFTLYQAGIFGSIFPAGGGPAQPLTQAGHDHETGINPRFALSYQVNDDTLIFAEAAKGFRFGGVNYPLPNTCALQAPASFGPDKVWSYQVGEKANLFDKRVKLNLTGFWIDWEDVQTQQVDFSCSYFFFVAQGKVRSRGVEAETSARLTDRLTLSANGSYTDAKAQTNLPDGTLAGAELTRSPKYIASAALDYNLPVGADAVIDFHGDWRYHSAKDSVFLTAYGDSIVIPKNNQFNLAVNYLAGRYEFGVFVRNVGNSKEVLSEGSNYAKPPTVTNFGGDIVYGRPRTIGVRVKAVF